MSSAKTTRSEFVGVLRLFNHYAAFHENESQVKFISKNPETDIKVAQATAKRFSETSGIPYKETLFQTEKPIITVIKSGEKWFPAELYADRIFLLMKFGPMDLGGTQEETIRMADAIALSRRTNSIPSFGIFLEDKK